MDNKIAVFVDGGFFVRRVEFFSRKYFGAQKVLPEHMVSIMLHIINQHQAHLKKDILYRIYYYDAPPFTEQLREPVVRPGDKGGARTKNFKTDPRTIRQLDLHQQLSKTRKVALRMGELAATKRWILNEYAQKSLLKGDKRIDELTPEDFHPDFQQKGVDTRIGIDITTLTLSQFVDTMVLIASDADFVPAAKLARTHGVDVVLDPLFGTVAKGLEKHIDGKKSFDIVKKLSELFNVQPNPIPEWWGVGD